MSVVMEEEIKRWTARRKSALVLEIIQGKTTLSEASRQFDLAPSEIESWVEDGKRGMENALKARPTGVEGDNYDQSMLSVPRVEGGGHLYCRTCEFVLASQLDLAGAAPFCSHTSC